MVGSSLVTSLPAFLALNNFVRVCLSSFLSLFQICVGEGKTGHETRLVVYTGQM